MNNNIIDKIECIIDADQNSIREFKSDKIDKTELQKRTQINIDFIKNIINQCGFPFIDTTSPKAYKAAFLAVQHSEDIDLMEKVIQIFKNSSSDQIERRDLAFMIDRLRVLKNMPQIFGTQYKIEDREIKFLPIENEKVIDAKRKEFSMESFAEYKKLIHDTLCT